MSTIIMGLLSGSFILLLLCDSVNALPKKPSNATQALNRSKEDPMERLHKRVHVAPTAAVPASPSPVKAAPSQEPPKKASNHLKGSLKDLVGDDEEDKAVATKAAAAPAQNKTAAPKPEHSKPFQEALKDVKADHPAEKQPAQNKSTMTPLGHRLDKLHEQVNSNQKVPVAATKTKAPAQRKAAAKPEPKNVLSKDLAEASEIKPLDTAAVAKLEAQANGINPWTGLPNSQSEESPQEAEKDEEAPEEACEGHCITLSAPKFKSVHPDIIDKDDSSPSKEDAISKLHLHAPAKQTKSVSHAPAKQVTPKVTPKVTAPHAEPTIPHTLVKLPTPQKAVPQKPLPLNAHAETKLYKEIHRVSQPPPRKATPAQLAAARNAMKAENLAVALKDAEVSDVVHSLAISKKDADHLAKVQKDLAKEQEPEEPAPSHHKSAEIKEDPLTRLHHSAQMPAAPHPKAKSAAPTSKDYSKETKALGFHGADPGFKNPFYDPPKKHNGKKEEQGIMPGFHHNHKTDKLQPVLR